MPPPAGASGSVTRTTIALAAARALHSTYSPSASRTTARRPEPSPAMVPSAREGPTMVALVCPSSASYSTQGTVAPRPAGSGPASGVPTGPASGAPAAASGEPGGDAGASGEPMGDPSSAAPFVV